MRITRNEIDNLKSKVSPEEFYLREGLQLGRRRYSDWCPAGLCPFHDDQNTGNFDVNLDFGGYKCHACGEGGGDIIAFVQRKHGCSFPEAFRRIKSEYWY